MASTEEVSPFLISLLFPISFSFSSFLAFFLPSSSDLFLSSSSSNSFQTSLSPSLDPSPFLFSSSLPPPTSLLPIHSFQSPGHSLPSLPPFFPLSLSVFLYEPFCGYARDWVTVVSNCNMGLFGGTNIEPVSCTAS